MGKHVLFDADEYHEQCQAEFVDAIAELDELHAAEKEAFAVFCSLVGV